MGTRYQIEVVHINMNKIIDFAYCGSSLRSPRIIVFCLSVGLPTIYCYSTVTFGPTGAVLLSLYSLIYVELVNNNT